MHWGLPANAENTPHIWNHIAKFTCQVVSNRCGDWKKSVGSLLLHFHSIATERPYRWQKVSGWKPTFWSLEKSWQRKSLGLRCMKLSWPALLFLYVSLPFLSNPSCLFATNLINRDLYVLTTWGKATGHPSTNSLKHWRRRRQWSRISKFLGKCFGWFGSLASSVLWQLFIEDETKYCRESSGAIIAELMQLSSPKENAQSWWKWLKWWIHLLNYCSSLSYIYY